MLAWFARSTEGLSSTNSSTYSNIPSTGETWAQKLFSIELKEESYVSNHPPRLVHGFPLHPYGYDG